MEISLSDGRDGNSDSDSGSQDGRKQDEVALEDSLIDSVDCPSSSSATDLRKCHQLDNHLLHDVCDDSPLPVQLSIKTDGESCEMVSNAPSYL